MMAVPLYKELGLAYNDPYWYRVHNGLRTLAQATQVRDYHNKPDLPPYGDPTIPTLSTDSAGRRAEQSERGNKLRIHSPPALWLWHRTSVSSYWPRTRRKADRTHGVLYLCTKKPQLPAGTNISGNRMPAICQKWNMCRNTMPKQL